MSVHTEILVGRCVECPFYERTVASALADWLGKAEARRGSCKFNAVGPTPVAFPYARMHVPDEQSIPAACPLRGDRPATIRIRSGK